MCAKCGFYLFKIRCEGKCACMIKKKGKGKKVTRKKRECGFDYIDDADDEFAFVEVEGMEGAGDDTAEGTTDDDSL